MARVAGAWLMAVFILRRIMVSIPLIWAVLTAVFIGFHLIPGDPAEIMLFGRGTAADVARLRHELGLDQPLPVQYWNFLTHAVHLDFGRSITSHQPVFSELFTRLPYTAAIAAGALLVGIVLGLTLGILAALNYHNWLGTALTGLGVVGISLPSFWVGTMLALVFGVELGWLPVAGTGDLRNLILPVLTLAIPLGASLSRLVRASLVDVLGQLYIRTARAKGVRYRMVIVKHALKNALIPVVTVIGLSAAGLLSGAVFVEIIFSWPGLGSWALGAVSSRDFPVIEGTTFFFAILLISANLVVDISYALLDPRIRYS